MEERVKELIEQKINDNGYLLDKVEYVVENNTNFLRIIVDKEHGYININDCVLLNHELNPILDKIDFIEDSYIVDICSKEKGCE